MTEVGGVGPVLLVALYRYPAVPMPTAPGVLRPTCHNMSMRGGQRPTWQSVSPFVLHARRQFMCEAQFIPCIRIGREYGLPRLLRRLAMTEVGGVGPVILVPLYRCPAVPIPSVPGVLPPTHQLLSLS